MERADGKKVRFKLFASQVDDDWLEGNLFLRFTFYAYRQQNRIIDFVQYAVRQVTQLSFQNCSDTTRIGCA